MFFGSLLLLFGYLQYYITIFWRDVFLVFWVARNAENLRTKQRFCCPGLNALNATPTQLDRDPAPPGFCKRFLFFFSWALHGLPKVGPTRDVFFFFSLSFLATPNYSLQ